MTDLFISYSRRDKIFAQQLVDALKAGGRDIWADWEDIPAASDWEAEIQAGIEAAETVVFVLSPEWLASKECAKELAYAVKHNKRLVPLVWQNIDPKVSPPELASLNWIFCREADNFDQAFQTLNTTLDTDLEWIKAHTRLLVRAIEWERKKRDSSFLLRGQDLLDAEQWQVQSNKQTEPTPLQREYILASRKSANRLQRFRLAAVTAGMVLALVLAVIAVFQWQEANVQRDKARLAEITAVDQRDRAVSAEATAVAERDRAAKNYRLASARELAAAAINNLSADPQRSLLLALQAGQILKQDPNQPLTFEVIDALHRSVQASRLKFTLPEGSHTGAVAAVAFSPDQVYLATSGVDGTLKIWDLATWFNEGRLIGQELLTFPVDEDSSSTITSFAFSPDWTHLAIASTDGTVKVMEMMLSPQTGAGIGKVLLTLSGHTASISDVAFSPDGTKLATASADGDTKVWDIANSPGENLTLTKALLTLPGHKGPVSTAAFSPDGLKMATVSESGTVQVWDIATPLSKGATSGQELYTLAQAETRINKVVFSPDGKLLAIAGEDYVAHAWRVDSGEEMFALTGHTDIIQDIAFSPDGQLIATASWDNTAKVWDAATGQEKFSLLGHTGDVYGVAFSPDGNFLVTASEDQTAKIWDISFSGGNEAGEYFTHQGQPVTSIATSSQSDLIATTGGDGTVEVSKSELDQVVPVLPGYTAWANKAAFSPDGTRLALASEDGTASVWDMEHDQELYRLPVSDVAAMTIAWSPDGSRLATADDEGTVSVWAVERQRMEHRLSDFTSGVNDIAFSPDGTRLAIVGMGYTLTLWDFAHDKIEFSFQVATDEVTAVGFSPDGTRLATASLDGQAKVWDMTANPPQELFSLTGHTGGINDLTFSPEGEFIATASRDKTAKVWDARNGLELFSLSSYSGPLNVVAFTSDSTKLVTGGDDGVLRFYLLEEDDLVAHARSRLVRSLTPQECEKYLHQAQCPAP